MYLLRWRRRGREISGPLLRGDVIPGVRLPEVQPHGCRQLLILSLLLPLALAFQLPLLAFPFQLPLLALPLLLLRHGHGMSDCRGGGGGRGRTRTARMVVASVRSGHSRERRPMASAGGR